jgi:hypothetical protein
MPLLGGNRRQRSEVADLLTGTITAAKDGWRVLWWGDGATPPSLIAATLTEAANQAVAAAAALYAANPPVPGAELQLAIYPGGYAKGAPMFDIGGGPGHFVARGSHGGDRVVEAASLESLVCLVARMPDGNTSMFRWICQVTELPGRKRAATGEGR